MSDLVCQSETYHVSHRWWAEMLFNKLRSSWVFDHMWGELNHNTYRQTIRYLQTKWTKSRDTQTHTHRNKIEILFTHLWLLTKIVFLTHEEWTSKYFRAFKKIKSQIKNLNFHSLQTYITTLTSRHCCGQ